jgi:hypothetical protein
MDLAEAFIIWLGLVKDRCMLETPIKI